jgi:hypothetical protein
LGSLFDLDIDAWWNMSKNLKIVHHSVFEDWKKFTPIWVVVFTIETKMHGVGIS